MVRMMVPALPAQAPGSTALREELPNPAGRAGLFRPGLASALWVRGGRRLSGLPLSHPGCVSQPGAAASEPTAWLCTPSPALLSAQKFASVNAQSWAQDSSPLPHLLTVSVLPAHPVAAMKHHTVPLPAGGLPPASLSAPSGEPAPPPWEHGRERATVFAHLTSDPGVDGVMPTGPRPCPQPPATHLLPLPYQGRGLAGGGGPWLDRGRGRYERGGACRGRGPARGARDGARRGERSAGPRAAPAALPTWRRPRRRRRRRWRASLEPERARLPEPGARPPAPPRAARPPWLLLLLAAAAAGPGACGAARLYRAGEDAVWVLDSGSVRGATGNSSAAWLVQFYSSWCGHCIGYAPTWRALAADVRDWAAAIRVAALDCADEKNHGVCRAYDVHFYPSFRYFKAFTKEFTPGENFKGPDRELQTVRHAMVDFLQNHTEGDRPPACPSLDPVQPSDILSLFDNRGGHYVAILFESNSSYLGREVILDLIPYENIVVNRALNLDKALLEKLGVSSVPSCYLICPNGTHGVINVAKPLRSFFSSFLRSLPGVRKRAPSLPEQPRREEDSDPVAWREFDRSRLYMADLESGLHHLLRVELAAHRSLVGAELKTLKDFLTILAKLFPGRPPVLKLLEMLQEWLGNLPLDRIPYDAVLDLVNNKMQISGIFLSNHTRWVGCQGSRPELRGYPCSLWKLFHTLTVRAGTHPKALAGTGFEDDPQAVLQVVRRYVRTFFGCKECGEHFEEMAKESMDLVKTPDQAILWLWKKHNVVNSRLAGHLSEDPRFPKVPWPTPDLCPACHEEVRGLDSWDEDQVLAFLKRHYGRDSLGDPDPVGPGEPGEGRAAPRRPSGSRGSEGSSPRPAGQWHHGPAARQEVAPWLGASFSSLDMSLCVALYVASSLFLMVVFFFFRVRSRRGRAKHFPPAV
ncbi:sulfhydryl oxidase 2 [Choloepus didactylus]|uniref:sulfhydryl oxidase 2 n=1 Tax=Choloepus didactylus TaxID=27675 RepID=UPI00189F61AA|nr:sulfhydryl oxidase 2 [Choloepus didactylus]